MEEQQTPLMRLMQNEGFRPFSGPDAIRVYGKAVKRLNMENISEDDLLNAVSSLGMLLETEIALIYALQDQICTRCGACCSEYRPMRVQKQELKVIADHQHTSYKKLKKETKARPRGDGTMRITRNPCPFYDEPECSIYTVRPSPCRGYPANRLLRSIAGKGGYPDECEISDDLLVEIVIKRAIEEKMYRENPELIEELAAKKRQDMQRLAGMNQSQRLSYLVKRYQRNLKES